jgi:hypothetical protein
MIALCHIEAPYNSRLRGITPKGARNLTSFPLPVYSQEQDAPLGERADKNEKSRSDSRYCSLPFFPKFLA